ncbi:hypothetical protein E2C01_005157 [Portunus trituberculatus]|uniref:Uncharacterized protein n=1 Tax=Portunus trituberculatus TaxID=210409 RepID=A0A5B7CSK5_PORTR|nr:hypothetical protein [Portunus trituberculatus]
MNLLECESYRLWEAAATLTHYREALPAAAQGADHQDGNSEQTPKCWIRKKLDEGRSQIETSQVPQEDHPPQVLVTGTLGTAGLGYAMW